MGSKEQTSDLKLFLMHSEWTALGPKLFSSAFCYLPVCTVDLEHLICLSLGKKKKKKKKKTGPFIETLEHALVASLT